MADTSKFWNRMARGYARSAISDQASYERKLAETRAHFTPDSKVFEFGCGTGSTALLHAPFVSHVHAIDFSSEMLAIAEERKAEAGVANVTFEQASIVDFEGADKRYDVVLGLSILHLLHEPDRAIAKAFDLLQPGGVFVSSTVCLTGVRRLIVGVAAIARRLGLLPILKGFSPEELKKMIVDQGFEIETSWQPGSGKAVFIIARKPD